jgi:hypothetical protein
MMANKMLHEIRTDDVTTEKVSTKYSSPPALNGLWQITEAGSKDTTATPRRSSFSREFRDPTESSPHETFQ